MRNGHTSEKQSQSNGMAQLNGNDSFAKGAIVKIHLKDFMTYNEVDFNPGPNLNLILGPNGTGKSTIVSAICLGMNGKPSLLARATTLGSYVRNGAAKATIDIELHNPDGPNHKITREITAIDNKSTWKYQGKHASKDEINQLIRGLCIQVDNLCQFLPQEQVQNFSRMNDKELLKNTMNAVGNPQLEEDFDKLKKMQEDFGRVATHQDKDEEEVRKLKAENARFENEVKNFRERAALQAKVKHLEEKKAWMVFNEEKKAYEEADAKFKDLNEEYQKASARFKPIEKNIADQEAVTKRLKTVLASKRDHANKTLTSLNSKLSVIETHRQSLDKQRTDLEGKRSAEKKRMEQVKALQQQIASMEQELEDLAAKEQENMAELKDVEQRMKSNEPRLTQVNQRKHEASEASTRIRYELNDARSKLKTLQDLDGARLNKLRGDRPDVYKAVMWLRDNKHRFKATIHEPPILSLSMRNPAMAMYIENSISNNDLVAFYCEDKSDMNMLLGFLRDEMKLGVNVVSAPPNPTGEPNTYEFQPSIAMSELRGYGFNSSLRELVTGPEPVIRYLCKNFRIHNIPVGDARVYENFGAIRDKIGGDCHLFFGGNKRIDIIRSRYRRDVITQVGDVRSAHLLGQSVDAAALEQCQHNVSEFEARLAESQRLVDQITAEYTVVSREQEALRQKKFDLGKYVGHRRTISLRIDQKKMQLNNSENDAVDLVQEERTVKENCSSIVRDMIAVLKVHCRDANAALLYDIDRDGGQILYEAQRTSIVAKQHLLATEKEKVQQLEDDKEAASRVAAAAKSQASEALKAARALSGVGKYDLLSDEKKALFNKLPDSTGEIEDEVHAASARIQLMGRADANVVRDYEERESRIQRLISQINKVNSRAATLKQEIEQKKNEFLPPILDLVSRINVSFGRYYASMRCAGEVMLYTGEGENQDDFENYGIKIRVKYRSSEPLIELSANHHSGGERAVATALYMLAMQELTQVPFRCVDEINQGMDPFNERRVFDLLVQTACHDSSAQYFLLTPKLLPGLSYSPNMKIHFVQNGEHVCDEWKVQRHLDVIRGLRNRN